MRGRSSTFLSWDMSSSVWDILAVNCIPIPTIGIFAFPVPEEEILSSELPAFQVRQRGENEWKAVEKLGYAAQQHMLVSAVPRLCDRAQR